MNRNYTIDSFSRSMNNIVSQKQRLEHETNITQAQIDKEFENLQHQKNLSSKAIDPITYNVI